MTSSIAAAILAGGEGRRMGGVKKAFVSLDGQTLIDRVLERLRPQADPIAMCIRRARGEREEAGLPLLEDLPNPACGPLGGIAAALVWAESLSPVPDWVITTPVDTPFLPTDLSARLTETDANIAVAQSGDQTHYTIAAWRPRLAHAVLEFLSAGAKPVRAFQETTNCVHMAWTTDTGDPFMNINTPNDVALAVERIKA